MKNKIFSLLTLSILTVLVLASFASATIVLSSVPTLSAGDKSFSITATGVAGDVLTLPTTITNIIGSTVTLATVDGVAATSVHLADTNSHVVVFNYNIPLAFVFQTGTTYSVDFGTLGSVKFSTDVPGEIQTCKLLGTTNAVNHLKVSIDSIKVTSGFGDHESWYPLDSIEAKVTVTNTGSSDKIRSVALRWGLYDTVSNEWIIKPTKEDTFTIAKDDETVSTLTFKLEDKITKFKDGSYEFYVWATGEDDQYSNETCYSTLPESNGLDKVSINLNTFVTIGSFIIPDSVSCGNTVQITGTAWNIGDDDQTGVTLRVYNAELGINQKVDLGTIDSLDNKDFSFTLNIPTTAKEGSTYQLTVGVYNKNGNIFENDNSDQAKFYYDLPVTIGCSTVPSALVTAVLQSDAKAGQEFTVKATVTNTGSASDTFNLALTGYNTWASLVSMDKSSVTLAAGTSQDVMIVLKANSDASGDQNFNIGLTQGTKSLSQPISVSLVKQGISLPSLSGLFTGNSWIWVIGALNVVLVLVIVFVAVKVSRKK
jgi:hypothetical protein